MYEKILSKLKNQRDSLKQAGKTSNVSDRTLETIAKSYEPVVTTDDSLTGFDFTNLIESLDGNINHVSSEAVKKVKTTTPPITTTPNTTPSEENPLMKQLQELSTLVGSLSQEVASLKTGTKKNQQLEVLKNVLANTPAYFTTPIIKSFEKLDFKDEDEFNEYVNDVKTSKETFIQSAKEQGLNTFSTPNPPKQEVNNGQTADLQKAQEVLRKAKEAASKS